MVAALFRMDQNTISSLFSLTAKQLGFKYEPDLFFDIQTIRDKQDVREYFLLNPKTGDIEKSEVFEILDDSEQELENLEKNKCLTMYPGHNDYPDQLLNTYEPPLWMSYRGNPVWKEDKLLSVVGSREPDPLALAWMKEELVKVCRDGYILISGAARGVDQAAHLVALKEQKPTIALLPSGLGEVYPKQFNSWMEEIEELGGAIISEYKYSTPMRKVNFQERNRIIATLSKSILIVQAKIRSGSLVTARHALSENRYVLAVPWDPMNSKASGTNQLLHDGAGFMRSGEDILNFISPKCV